MKKNSEPKENLLITIVLISIILPWVIYNQTKNKFDYDLKIATYKSAGKQKPILRGEILFKSENCNACHKPNKKTNINLTKNLLKRRDTNYLISFIKNEDSLLKAKHPSVIALKEEYNGANGEHNSKLPRKQIMDILYYLESYD